MRTTDQLAAKMRELGLTRIRFIDRGGKSYITEACRKRERVRIAFSRYGELINEQYIGRCRSSRLRETVDSFQNRNLSNVKLYVEGCRRGRLIRFELDDNGEVLNRQRVGRCR